jgi:signal-transduction protein with cAMP-binding, CBS, and nucleotidyltransferase domain
MSQMELIEFIESKVRLTPEERDEIDRAFKVEYHSKGTILIQPDSLSQKVMFIGKGLLRTFYNFNEKDVTHFFFDENSFLAAIESIFFNKTDPYGRQALEDCVLRTIHYRDFSRLTDRIVSMKQFAFLVTIDVCKLFADRIFSLQFQNAQERYANLLQCNPTILLRAPLGHIASYLGITQQTLSVIRSKK